ncbi:hypothetical protein D3C72_1350750 [compost metagenome]
MTQHRIELMQGFDFHFKSVVVRAQTFRQLFGFFVCVRNELMKWWIQQTDRHWQAFHDLEQLIEIVSLHWQKFRQSFFTIHFIISDDHLTNSIDTICAKEHVFCTAKTNALGTKAASCLSIFWSVGICSDFQTTNAISDFHDALKRAIEFWFDSFYFAQENFTCAAVQSDHITFFKNVAFYFHGFIAIVDFDITATRYATLTHTARNNRRMRGHTTTSRQDTLSRHHTSNVFW